MFQADSPPRRPSLNLFPPSTFRSFEGRVTLLPLPSFPNPLSLPFDKLRDRGEGWSLPRTWSGGEGALKHCADESTQEIPTAPRPPGIT